MLVREERILRWAVLLLATWGALQQRVLSH